MEPSNSYSQQMTNCGPNGCYYDAFSNGPNNQNKWINGNQRFSSHGGYNKNNYNTYNQANPSNYYQNDQNNYDYYDGCEDPNGCYNYASPEDFYPQRNFGSSNYAYGNRPLVVDGGYNSGGRNFRSWKPMAYGYGSLPRTIKKAPVATKKGMIL